jgi:hypothetical protein
VSGEPGFDLGVVVGGVVVEDEMDLETLGDLAVDRLEEGEELDVPVAGRH